MYEEGEEALGCVLCLCGQDNDGFVSCNRGIDCLGHTNGRFHCLDNIITDFQDCR